MPGSKAVCCGGSAKEIKKYKRLCPAGIIQTPVGEIPVVPAKLSIIDVAENFFARLGLGRMAHAVKPGLYAAGDPDINSVVLVSANYKMSFDALRKELTGIDAWILVLDTKGVNVWCAAGKGTFGTQELINRIKASKLDSVVLHRNLVVPQLGAPGIAAHIVRKYSGFKVVYGPVEARDIKTFLDNGMRIEDRKRQVEFGLAKRMEVIWIEFAGAVQVLLGLSVLALIAASFTKTGFSLQAGIANSAYFMAAMLVAALSATIIPAALLPVLPGRMFSIKGAVAGLVSSLMFVYLVPELTLITKTSFVILTTSVSAFVFMNYTGATTFTSLTSVRKEISTSAPAMIVAAFIGIVLQIIDFVIKGAIKWN